MFFNALDHECNIQVNSWDQRCSNSAPKGFSDNFWNFIIFNIVVLKIWKKILNPRMHGWGVYNFLIRTGNGLKLVNPTREQKNEHPCIKLNHDNAKSTWKDVIFFAIWDVLADIVLQDNVLFNFSSLSVLLDQLPVAPVDTIKSILAFRLAKVFWSGSKQWVTFNIILLRCDSSS